MRLQSRLHLDIGWGDLASVFAPLQASRAELDARIRQAWPEHAVPALSVRTAFDAVLASLALPEGAAVAMSAVTIQNMADVVRAHGLTLVPVDIELHTLSPSPGDVDRTLAATGARVYVHAHLYGARNDLSEIAAICHARGALLIEDCAQAYAGAPPAHAQQADVSLYSFGPIKARTSLGGAIALCRESERAAALRTSLAALAPMPEAWLRQRALKYAALKFLSMPLPYALIVVILRARGVDHDAALGGAARGFSGGDLMHSIRHAPPRALLRLLARRTAPQGAAGWRERVGATLDQELARAFERPGSAAPMQAFWLYPILVDDPKPTADALRAAGFDATRGATSLRAIGGVNAELLIRHVLYLPIAPSMRAGALKRMAKAVRAQAGAWRGDAGRMAA